MDRRAIPSRFVLSGAVLSALLCGALAASAQGQGGPSGSSPPTIVLKGTPGGGDRSPLGDLQLQVAGLQLEIQALQSQLAANQAALQSLQTSHQNLQKEFANHYHNLQQNAGGGLNEQGWSIFDVTEHGGPTITVGLRFTCAPGVDPRCKNIPTTTYNETTSKPVQPAPQSP